MFSIRHMARTPVLALSLAAVAGALPAQAAPADYRFELAGKPTPAGGKDLVQVRLLHLPDNKPVTDAVIFETTADMGPAGMESMTAPASLMPASAPGVYSVAVEPGMTGSWAIHLSAKVQGEAETVHASITAPLVK
jgi:hypothetical protein